MKGGVSVKGSQFKAPKIGPYGKPGDLREHCERFQMKAQNEKDMVFLAHLYSVIWVHGGTVTIDDGKKRQTYRF